MTTLEYVLLGLLAREPLSGYDLAQQIKTRVAFFWRAQHGQIYPALARMERAGLVVYEFVAQAERPNKKIYRPTEAGIAALRAWLTTPVEIAPARDELVLRAYCIWLADRAGTIALFREHERLHRERLALYERNQGWMAREWGERVHDPNSPHFASYIAIERGIGSERAYAEWCGWVAAQLEQTAAANER